MFNFEITHVLEEDSGLPHTALDMFFLQEDGGTFKATYVVPPYFLLFIKDMHSTKAQGTFVGADVYVTGAL